MSSKSFKSPISQVLGKIPLRIVMIVPFVLQITAAVGIVGYVSFQNGQKAVKDLANKLMDETTGRIEQNLHTYLEIPHRVNKIKLDALESKVLNMDNLSAWENFLWRLVQLYPEVNVSTVANKDGRIRAGDRLEDGTVLMPVLDDFTDYSLQIYNTNEKGERTTVAKVIPNDISGPERRYWYTRQVWYRDAIKADKATWGSITVSLVEPSLLITALETIHDRLGNTQGIMLTSLRLNSTGKFLRSLKIGKTGQAFIMDDLGRLVATSTDEIPFRIDENGKKQMFKATDSSERVTKATSAYLASHPEIFNNFQSSEPIDFKIDGQPQFLRLLPFRDEKGLNWLVAVVIPESDFMEQINANNRNTILLCIAALVIAIVFGIFTSRWISQPILKLSQAAQAIAEGNLHQNVEVKGLKEVSVLEISFNSMAEQLLDSFASLEAKNEALRIAEENYRSIFENALEGIFQATKEGSYMSINPAMARIYGYDSSAEMLAAVTDISAQLYVDSSSLDEFYRQMEEKGNVQKFEYRAYRKDGKIIWVQEDARAVRDTNGNVLYYEGLIQDITERKRREEELKRQLQELRIEIDQQKRQQEVAAITQSDYFQEIQAEASDIELDEFWN
ncbi:PAS domain S-box protein [Aerosakkonema funiforme]|uniref:histidine kinase n=2 Tax=Oscillatoriophycideae TaxID=1301283 RepID=A0A926VK76_9CYAN|nr:PAS domain S-box protein [Aerosakkonema funiforme]MBD2185340.1 PAS domain S-box protein [Aerosakkonema funiforme FACHB-1375]